MNDPIFSNWTEQFTRTILTSSLEAGDDHETAFLNKKLQEAVRMMNETSKSMQDVSDPRAFYNKLCVFIQDSKSCMFWYERSLEYEKVSSSNSRIILEQGKSMINMLEATLNVIRYQETLN